MVRVFPLPLGLHIAFAIVGFIFFFLQYRRKGFTYQLLLMVAIPSTLLIYYCNTEFTFWLLALEELVLIIWMLVSSVIEKRQRAVAAAKAFADADNISQTAELTKILQERHDEDSNS